MGSIATSRHPQVARLFLSQADIDKIMNANSTAGIGTGTSVAVQNVNTDPGSGITIENIQGPNFKGKVMLIKDPKRIHLQVTNQIGAQGERVSQLVKDAGAIAGINAGGFFDPDGKGNGSYPDGITVQNGQIVYNNLMSGQKANIVGFDVNGKFVIGNMNANDIIVNKIQQAVTFSPNLIVNGKPVVQGDGGWGIAPRTGIGQTADGTVILVVIDGRQPTWSLGATLRDLMNVFIQYHAVSATNLDGGSSTTMSYNGSVQNKLADIFGERYVPDAFVVMPQ